MLIQIQTTMTHRVFSIVNVFKSFDGGEKYEKPSEHFTISHGSYPELRQKLLEFARKEKRGEFDKLENVWFNEGDKELSLFHDKNYDRLTSRTKINAWFAYITPHQSHIDKSTGAGEDEPTPDMTNNRALFILLKSIHKRIERLENIVFELRLHKQ